LAQDGHSSSAAHSSGSSPGRSAVKMAEASPEVAAPAVEGELAAPAVEGELAAPAVEAVEAAPAVEAVEAVEAAPAVEAVEAVEAAPAVEGAREVEAAPAVVEQTSNVVAESAVVMETKPVQQSMGGLDAADMGPIETNFAAHDAFLVKQTMRGCIQECLGCEARSEFKIAELKKGQVTGMFLDENALNNPEVMTALEESSFCMRCCWRDGRGFDMHITQGAMEGGPPVAKFRKPCGFPLNFLVPASLIAFAGGPEINDFEVPCCCLLPQLELVSGQDVPLGYTSKYICDQNIYVPKLAYYEKDEMVYLVKPPTCCGGCCIDCCANGCCKGFAFFFHDPVTMEPIGGAYDSPDTPQIRKVWAGLKKECCSTADTFVVQFPDDIDPIRKAGLVGLTFLIDFTVFERQNEKK